MNDTTYVDYYYENNGNLNKGITSIKCNFLSLPSKVKKEDNHKVVYICDSSGMELRIPI
jgi:hypothetical protein